MDEIFKDLMACRDAVDCIQSEMQLLYMALEQLDQPITFRARDRVYLLVDHFRFFVNAQLAELQVKTQRVTNSLITINGGSNNDN